VSNRIEDLEPVTRAAWLATLSESEQQGILLRTTHTYRTADEQLHLYAKGRALVDGEWVVVDASKVVTKAPPGHSPHEFRMGVDFCFVGPDPYLDAYPHAHDRKPDPRWAVVGAIGEGHGLSWGGPLGEGDRFTWDSPHFQRRDWRTAKADAVWP
jgi:hypothetical protein